MRLSELSRELALRAARATGGMASPANDLLRRHLRDRFESPAGKGDSFLAEPVIEAMFPWLPAEKRLEDLPANLIHANLLDALDAKSSSRFPRNAKPYKHQLAAWQILGATPPRSLVVTSGTGSGKTECFLVPILNDFCHEAQSVGQLAGVRALFLYPLNALIASQRDRLSAWTKPLGGKVRFSLYNGLTPESVPANDQKSHPEEVLSRKGMREAPAPLLITNATMLEYMLVRQKDRSILDKSKGMLRWIVLDEAHTYVGSQAAEVALLLRRVMYAFGVAAKDVRFVATSATIGTATDTAAKLQQYLADIAGVDPSQVDVVTGERLTPTLPPQSGDAPTLTALRAAEGATRYQLLSNHPDARSLREQLVAGPKRLSSLIWRDKSAAEMLEFIDLAHPAKPTPDAPSFLPVRCHFFHRTQSGVWVCVSPTCPAKVGTILSEAAWPFGAVHFERRDICACGSKAYELVLCRTCGECFLEASEVVGSHGAKLESVLGASSPDDDVSERESDDDGEEAAPTALIKRRLFWAPRSAAPLPRKLSVKYGTLDATDDESVIIQLAKTPSCTRCGTNEQIAQEVFRPVRLGAPFYLQVAVPTLLEHSPPETGDNERRASGGRRTLTFSDSRQGSARFALRLQLESERSFVRGWIYHQLAANRPTAISSEERVQLESKLALFKTASAMFQQEIRATEAKLAPSSAGVMTWGDARKKLADTWELKRAILPDWKRRYRVQFDEMELAQLLLLRELVRRPQRANSLETMGAVMLDYPSISAEATLPPLARQYGMKDGDWLDFLRIVIDYQVRSQTAVELPPADSLRWLGAPIHQRFIAPPDTEPADVTAFRWPRCRTSATQSRLARLLARALGLTVEQAEDRAVIDDLLVEAWQQIRKKLSNQSSGYLFALEPHTVIRQAEKAWICPVTRRLLTTTLKGYSPYASSASFDACAQVALPQLPFPFARMATGAAATPAMVREWLDSDPTVVALRELGQWGDLHDKLTRPPDIVRVGEHSAQQSASLLGQLTEKFKKAELNVLSCSTTMEMGVDIGGLSSVAMNNAPPGPANFLQRAGRAGRRQETAAASVTMCKAVPHGEEVFRNPLWPFEQALHVPRVSLQSAPIVSRHLNALALSSFLLRYGDALQLKSGWFFGVAGASSPADELAGWLRSGGDPNGMIGKALVTVATRSVFDGSPPQLLLDTVAERLEAVGKAWRLEHDALAAELEEIGGPPQDGKDASPAQRAVVRLLERLEGHYLLRALTDRGFLPVHGFPTGVVPFITLTMDDLKKREGDHEQDDRAETFPSRELQIAIREYAPGNSLVIDGKVFESAGVTLNWRLPPSVEAANEIQAFRQWWRCRTCGAVGSMPSVPHSCVQCGSPDVKHHSYLQPAGFSVDLTAAVTNDSAVTNFIPPRVPLVSGSGQWVSLADPTVGRFRATTEGHVLHYSDGATGWGYAICLACGRAASETGSVGPMPDSLLGNDGSGHYRLRGGVERNSLRRCRGNDSEFAIKRRQHLGVDITTEVFELQLHPAGGAPASAALGAIAVALRQATAAKLGIEPEEIGWALTMSEFANGVSSWGISLFDEPEGGAGYVSQIPQHLEALLKDARTILNCPRKCDRACHACLLSYDTQFSLDVLDRNEALKVLTAELDKRLCLPAVLQEILGSNSRLEVRPLLPAVVATCGRPDLSEIRIYLSSDTNAHELTEWVLRPHLLRWAGTRKVLLVVTEQAFAAMDSRRRGDLLHLVRAAGVVVHAIPDDPPQKFLAVELGGSSKRVQFAVTTDEARTPGELWGTGCQVITLESDTPLAQLAGRVVTDLELDLAAAFDTAKVVRSNQCDGPVSEFGAKQLKLLVEAVHDVKTRFSSGAMIAAIEYSDRYFQDPVAIRLLVELVRAMLRQTPNDAKPHIEVRFVDKANNKTAGNKLYGSDVPSSIAIELATMLLNPLASAVSVSSVSKGDSSHGRELLVRWADGFTWSVTFDGGLSWGLQRVKAKPFNPYAPMADFAKQVEGDWQVQSKTRPNGGFEENFIHISRLRPKAAE